MTHTINLYLQCQKIKLDSSVMSVFVGHISVFLGHMSVFVGNFLVYRPNV